MNIFVNYINRRSFSLTIRSSDTVSSLKRRIEELEGIPSHDQRLYFGSVKLEDNHSLAECNIPNNGTLYLIDEQLILSQMRY